MSPNAGKWGTGCGVSANEYSCTWEPKINFLRYFCIFNLYMYDVYERLHAPCKFDLSTGLKQKVVKFY